MIKLILLFTIIPLIELSIIFRISHVWGTLFAVTLIAATGLLGAAMTKRQGHTVLKEIKKALEQGLMPADRLIDGILILIGGVFLITPGIITDLVGFCCIIPFTRRKIKLLAKDQFSRLIQPGKFQFTPSENQARKTINIVKKEKKNNNHV